MKIAEILRAFESSLGPWLAFAYRVFGWCVGIAESGLVSAGLPCCRLDVEIRCRLTRRLVVVVALLKAV